MPDETGKSFAEKYPDFLPEEPELSEYENLVYGWYSELDSARHTDMGNPLPISYAEIESWSRATGAMIRPDEVKLIVMMDRAHRIELKKFRDAVAENQKGSRK